jgi:hypothetical protein
MQRFLFISCLFFFLASCSKEKFNYSECPTVDSMMVSYNADIKSIVNANCVTCHYSNSTLDSTMTYDFSNYNGIKRAIGSVYNRIIRPVDDPLHMPVGIKLSDCDLLKLKIWIQNGAPEN